ncbi:MAG: hypothetical protein ACTSPD_11185 [Promethearchaeota archaeon]
MSKKIDTSAQWNEFYVKKGQYLVELSENHYMNKEYKKSLELLSQAYAMYEKGGAHEEAAKVKEKFNSIKSTHFKKKE